MNPVYHPLSVCGAVDYTDGSFSSSFTWGKAPPDPYVPPNIDDPAYGTTLHLRNTLDRVVWIAGLRTLNQAWEVIILQIGPVKGPFDAAAFNLDAVPGVPTGARVPTSERPRFVHYPMGILEPGEELPIRAVPYGAPAVWTLLNLLVFVTPWEGGDG